MFKNVMSVMVIFRSSTKSPLQQQQQQQQQHYSLFAHSPSTSALSLLRPIRFTLKRKQAMTELQLRRHFEVT